MNKVKSTIDIAIELIINEYHLTDGFEIQDKLFDIFEMDVHIYDIIYSEVFITMENEMLDLKEMNKFKELTYNW